MRSRSFLYSTIAVVLALFLLTAGGLTWFFGQNPKRLLKIAYGTSPTTTMFISSQAPFVTSLLVKPEQIEAFQQAVTSGDRRSAGAELAQLKRGLLATFNLNYEQDVQPWLGDELTFAVTTADLDRNAQTGRQPGYLLVLTTQDSEKTKEFLDLFWQKQSLAGVNLETESYKGVKLTSGQSVGVLPKETMFAEGSAPLPPNPSQPNKFNLVTALVNDRFLLLANHPKVLREAINTVQADGLSLANTASYQQAMQNLTPDHIGFLFANIPQLKSWLVPDRGNKSSTVKGSFSKLTSSVEGQAVQAPIEPAELAVAIGLERQGIRLETLLFRDQALHPQEPAIMNASSFPSLSQPVEAMTYLPTTSLLSLASRDLGRLWPIVETLQHQDGLIGSFITQTLDQLQTQWGIDLQQDFLSWVQGEYALAAIQHPQPQDQPKGTITPLDWIFVLERSADATAAIEHLDDLARQDGFSVGPLTIGQQQVSAWTKLTTTNLKLDTPLNLQAQVRGVHTTIDRYELFTTSLEGMAQALQAKNNSLLGSSNFQTGIANLPKPNGGYLYLNWPASEAILTQRFPFLNLLRLAGKPWFDPLRALTFTPYQSSNNTANAASQNQILKGELFIQLGESDR